MVFRTVGASSRSLVQALCPSAIFILALMTYTGFVVPIGDMHLWFRWINYIDPIAYAFESLMINEFHGRDFECGIFVPAGPQYADVGALNHICDVVGAVPGSNVVSGTEYTRLSFDYVPDHLWRYGSLTPLTVDTKMARNFGIIITLTMFFTCTYLLASEYVTAKKSKGEVLLFQRGRKSIPNVHSDEEKPGQTIISSQSSDHRSNSGKLHKQTSVFHWRDICFDIKIKKEDRGVLSHVDGWVKPGTLTALMVSHVFT